MNCIIKLLHYVFILFGNKLAIKEKIYSINFLIFRHGRCPISSSNRQQTCEVGLRSRRFFVLSGSVLALWSPMERILPEGKIQMIRIKTTPINNQLTPLKIVGCIIPKRCLQDLVHLLEESSRDNYFKSA
jgi:hypothetical protein